MSEKTPSDFQRLASVVRMTFPAPLAVPFFLAAEGGDPSRLQVLFAWR